MKRSMELQAPRYEDSPQESLTLAEILKLPSIEDRWQCLAAGLQVAIDQPHRITPSTIEAVDERELYARMHNGLKQSPAGLH